MNGSFLRKFCNYILDLLFPDNVSCLCCKLPISRKNYISLCKSCYLKLDYIDEMCNLCGRSGKGSSVCFKCANEVYYFDKVYSVFAYNKFIHSFIYRLKYGRESYLADFFANCIKELIADNGIKFDFIIPVPIHYQRERERGFNQSDLIAKSIDGESCISLFKRVKDTKFLSELKKSERILEVKDAFVINEYNFDFIINEFYKKNVDRKIKLLIIDDIFTTGSTVNELSKVLKDRIYNVEITVITFANAKK